MGCDIHIHFEIKVDDEWLHYSAPRIDRDYDLFEKMAGVRGSVENAIVAPKGMPDNVSKTTLMEFRWLGSDGHTFSWLNKKEIRELCYLYTETIAESWEQIGYLFGNDWKFFDEYRKDYPPEIQDIRLVFWFDN